MTSTEHLIEKYRLRAVALTPLHVGSGDYEKNEILKHPVSEDPFIQASGISGVFRTVSEMVNGPEVTRTLFGQSHGDDDESLKDVGSKIRFSDGEFDLKTVKVEFRPRVCIDPASETVSFSKIAGSGHQSGHKFDMELIASGAEFTFFLYLFHSQEDHLKEELEHLLAECLQEKIRIGGQKSNGGGVIGLRALEHCSFDLKTADGRKNWSKEHLNISSWQPIHALESVSGQTAIAYEIEIFGQTEGALLVKGISVDAFGPDAPDSQNIKNANGDYIVPGSSLKGKLRSHMSRIASHMAKPGLVTEAFGEKGASVSGSRGIVQVRDILVGKEEKDVQALLQHRIHIDKFTGGVMNGGLFSEEVISGSIRMQISIENRKNPQAITGLLLFAVRDLAAGVFNIGSGYSVGRGFIKVKQLRIRSAADGRTALIDFENSMTEDTQHLIPECLRALQNWGEEK